MYIVIALIVGFLVGLGIKSTMSTVKPSGNASYYVVDNSLKFSIKEDNYLYSRTTSTKKG